MFRAEPQERGAQEGAAEFEAYAAKDVHQKLVRAGWATAVFVGTILAITPISVWALTARLLGQDREVSRHPRYG